MKKTVDVVIPSYKPDHKFDRLMHMLQKQTYPIGTILIVNTEEKFFPEKGYETWQNVQIRHIETEDFDHGGTRDGAASLLDGDLILFMTQDAVPADVYLVEKLVSAFEKEKVAAAYARQLPNAECSFVERYTRAFNYPDTSLDKDCDIIERYTRSFNYPKESSVKTKADLDRLGIKTFFCSNVCAMYRRNIYEKLGGFVKHTIFNEDMIFAGKLIQEGYAIAYVAEARVIHSHNYTNFQQFQRNFDMAVSQADHPEIFAMAKSESEGIRMVKATAAYLISQRKPYLIPVLGMRSASKLLGYRLGRSYQKLPENIVLHLTGNKSYWEKKKKLQSRCKN